MKETEFYSKLINLEDSLLRFAQHLTADGNDARDLVQETFLKVLKNKENLRMSPVLNHGRIPY
jgi:DNA-directed RNA polymerase specialized sigma24 family protein